jgi:glycosyltransferase involved in cell wall biosynthesis
MIHELFADEFADAKRAAKAKRAAVNRADHIICVSENTRQDLVRVYGVDPARTSVVHLGSSMDLGAPADEALSGSTAPSLLYVGHRRGYKNFHAVLQAYADSATLRDFELVAFGGPRPTPDERKEIDRLGLGDRVRFEAGSDQKLAAHYRRATVFVYPSKYEGFGIPPLEAMNYGCPVVCSDRASIPEVVGDAGVYFDPDDVEDLRAKLERVATSDELQADLRARGQARLTAFSWDRCAAATAQIYRDVMNSAAPSAPRSQ